MIFPLIPTLRDDEQDGRVPLLVIDGHEITGEREIADDREMLDDTYDAWERHALKMIRDPETAGRRVQKVPINIEALIAWCRERKCRIDMAARSEYVSYLLSQGGSAP